LNILKNGAAIRSIFPRDVKTAPFETFTGYLNYDGGWANAAQGVSIMTASVIAQGGKVIPRKHATKLLRRDGKTSAVQCGDGTVFDADLVILAVGSWTASSFQDLAFNGKCIATG
jgi:sarcosine oxidase/L-pipecolate oxidase